jgi:transposase-like protein
MSMAAVALAHGVNANLLRRWVHEAEQSVGASLTVAAPVSPASAFVPLTVEAPPAAQSVEIQLQRGSTSLKVAWPLSAASDCAAWLRELLR